MPRGDRTGPMGFGPKTGRGMGFCAGYNAPGFMNPGPGFGYGMGRGFGRGLGRGMGRGNRWGFYAAGQPGWGYGQGYYHPAFDYSGDIASHNMSERDEARYLKNQAEELARALDEINTRLDELSKEKSD